MSTKEKLAAQLPYLRRYARALTGSQHDGDAYVRTVLEAALADREVLALAAAGRVELYGVFNRIWASAHVELVADPAGSDDALQGRLSRMTPLNRQALLLTTLEGFATEEAAQIMALTPAEVEQLIREAVEEIDREAALRVLIIEDEPLISMHLEELVLSLGHDIFAIARTRAQAQEAVVRAMPDLVLSDIQLADGSSGIDAVADIAALGDVPVIFITAFPERLLTGAGNEPAFLITKPFVDATVKAAISQALYTVSRRAL